MKRNTPEHPKTARLMAHLDCELCTAVGVLELLWHCAAKFCKRGDIGRLSNQEIANVVGWRGDADALIDALLKSGWIEVHETCRLLIHDWADHCDDTVHRSAEVRKLGFIEQPKVRLPHDERRHRAPKAQQLTEEGEADARAQCTRASDEANNERAQHTRATHARQNRASPSQKPKPKAKASASAQADAVARSDQRNDDGRSLRSLGDGLGASNNADGDAMALRLKALGFAERMISDLLTQYTHARLARVLRNLSDAEAKARAGERKPIESPTGYVLALLDKSRDTERTVAGRLIAAQRSYKRRIAT